VEEVNKERVLVDDTVLPWDSIMILKPKDQNDFSFPNLPCMVIFIATKRQSQFNREYLHRMPFCKGMLVSTRYHHAQKFDAQSVGLTMILSKI
jgi:hypothetical protein